MTQIKPKIIITDICEDLFSENKRLKSDLMFANKCLNTLNKFKKYLNEMRHRFEDLLNSKERQELNELEIEYKLMIQSLNRRIAKDPYFGLDFHIKDNNFIIKEVIEFDSKNEDSVLPPNDKSIDRSDVEIKNINKNVSKDFRCDFRGCDRGFTSAFGLKVHKRKSHFSQTSDSNVIHETIETNVENNENSRNSEERDFSEDNTRMSFEESDEMNSETSEDESDSSVKPKRDVKQRVVLKKKSNKRNDRPVMCPVVGCNKQLLNESKLNRHLIETKAHLDLEFEPNLKFKCDFCSFRCDEEKWITRHKKAAHLDPSIECKVCHKLYKKTSSLDLHMKAAHTDWTIKCIVDGCEAVFKNPNTRSAHLFRVHNIGKPPKTYPCDYPDCGFVAKSKPFLKDHKYIHTGETPYVCEWPNCGFIGKNRKSYRDHQKFVHGQKTEKCPHCDYLGNRNTVRSHILYRHTEEKPFECQLCEKKFKTKSQLNVHQKSHNSNIKFNCPYDGCDKTFTSASNRYCHVKKEHTKAHRCEWPGCDYIATSPFKLTQHKDTHTGVTSYVCDWPECGFNASTKYNLIHHKYRHTGERPYPCTWPECDKKFRTGPTLQTHERLHKQDLCYPCDWPGCEYRTHDRGTLKYHKNRHPTEDSTRTEDTNKRLKVVLKSDNKEIKRSVNKRKKYETDSNFSDSE